MRSVKKLLGLGVVTTVLTLTACAPVASTWGSGPGLQLGISPTGNLSLLNSQCSFMSAPSGSPFMGSASAARVVMSRMQRVSQLQAKFQLASVGAPNREAWKSLAAGC